MRLLDLDENKTYTITFDINHRHSQQVILCVSVLMKFENSMKLRDFDTGVEKWFRTDTQMVILDEMPLKYLRKGKLENIEKQI